MDADSRLVFSWSAGGRDTKTGMDFVADVASRLKNRVRSDGFRFYPVAIEEHFGEDVDFTVLTKIFSREPTGKYSPPRFVGAAALHAFVERV